MKKLNLSDPSSRIVVCTSLPQGADFPNSDYLCIGKRYHLCKLEKISDHVSVYLEEFPEKIFNTEHFSEIFSAPEEIQAITNMNERKPELLALTQNTFFKLVLADETEVFPEWDIIQKLKPNEYYTIGRSQDCSRPIKETYISRLHCYIYKNKNNQYAVVDCSTYGTYLLL